MARFSGTRKQDHALLRLRGTISFELTDEFRDPLDVGEKVQPILEQIDGLIVQANILSVLGAASIAAFVRQGLGTANALLRGYTAELDRYILQRIEQIAESPNKLPTELPGGKPYLIVDRWSARFEARVYLNNSDSEFRSVRRK